MECLKLFVQGPRGSIVRLSTGLVCSYPAGADVTEKQGAKRGGADGNESPRRIYRLPGSQNGNFGKRVIGSEVLL
jgi:hypothetical protein